MFHVFFAYVAGTSVVKLYCLVICETRWYNLFIVITAIGIIWLFLHSVPTNSTVGCVKKYDSGEVYCRRTP